MEGNAPIAIVGMACRFAGAATPAALWRLIMSRRAAFTPFGGGAWGQLGATDLFQGRAVPAYGGQLENLYACRFSDGHLARRLDNGENRDTYFTVQLAFDALADAGMRRFSEPQRATVRFGYAPPFSPAALNWLDHTLLLDQTMELVRRLSPTAPAEFLDDQRARLVRALPPPDAEAFRSVSGSYIAQRIAESCRFSGAATACDAGGLSFAAALSAAMDDLRVGRSDVALAGAVEPPLPHAVLQGLSGFVPFTAANDCRPFSQDGSGTLPGEGGAFFVLKRRADALAARDRIYALVRDTAGGVTEVAADSQVPLASIALVESAAAGVAETDAAEAAALRRLWGDHRPGGPLVGVGSVKGNVGDCLHAAGAAGCVKAALAIHARILPPQVPCDNPCADLADLASSAYLLTEARPWMAADARAPRRAIVLAQDWPIAEGMRQAILLEEEPEARD